MQLVYFLLLPSALLSVPLHEYCLSYQTSSQSAEPVDWLSTILSTWLVVGCFALSAGWLERVRNHFVQIDGRLNAHAPWWLRNRFSLMVWLWCALQPCCLVASQWTAWTLQQGGDASHRSFQILMMVLPGVIFMAVIEWIGCASNVKRVSGHSGREETLRTIQRAWQNATHSWLLPLALPVVIASLAEIGNRVLPALPSMGMTGTVLCAISTSLVTTLLIPHLFVWLIRAKPADVSVEQQVAQVWRLGSNSVPRVLQWPTGCRVANAAVVGMLSQGRKLLLTDGLIQKLSERELALVVLHELAHCKRNHAWVRILPTIVTVVAMLTLMNILEGAWLSAACIVMLVIFLSSLILVCWWTEFDADRHAMSMASRLECYRVENASSFRSVDTRAITIDMANALRKIYGSGNQSKKSWLHPSCNQRIAKL